MYYCVRCGDKIEKDELVCDKCGLHFTVVQGDSTIVYINRTTSPNVYPNASQPVNTAATAVASAAAVTSAPTTAAPAPQAPVTPAAARPLTKADKKAIKKANKQKKKEGKRARYGWVIALTLLASGAVFVVTLIVLLIIGGLFGFILFFPTDTDAPEVVAYEQSLLDAKENSTTTYQSASSSDNTTSNSDALLSKAIREPFVTLKGDGTDTATVMIYMNGSDLESKYGYATADLAEILNSTLSDNVNVVIQTGGTKKWKTDGISSKTAQRFVVKDGKLVLVQDNLGQLDITQESTLSDFLTYCKTNYPADRNMLIFWDHGGGVVYGYGVDENVNDEYAALTLDEIQRAVANSGIKFEMIGFDACLMGGLETACTLCDYADYLLVSEDFESGCGWEYQNWLSLLGHNSSTSMIDIGKVVVDDFIKESITEDTEGVLALVDLRYTRLLYSTWTDFAYANEDELLSYDYTMNMQRSKRASGKLLRDGDRDIWDLFFGVSTMEEYCYAVDIMALAKTMNTDESNALSSVIKSSILYCSTTSGDSRMTGLSVTLPYGDSEFYSECKTVFKNCGFDDKYISFLGKFVGGGSNGSYDWDNSGYDGWDSYDEDEDDYDWGGYDWDDYWSYDYEWDSYDYGDSSDNYYCDDGYYYYDDDCDDTGWYNNSYSEDYYYDDDDYYYDDYDDDYYYWW
jgi:hypothetical protein